jgi:hypothetical protein
VHLQVNEGDGRKKIETSRGGRRFCLQLWYRRVGYTSSHMPLLMKITAQEVMYPTFQQYLQHFRHLPRLHLIFGLSHSEVPLLRHGCYRFPCLKLRRSKISCTRIRHDCLRMFPQPSLSKIQPQQPRKYRPRQERPNRASYDGTLTNRTASRGACSGVRCIAAGGSGG